MKRKPLFEELDYRETPMGTLSLRRRTVLALDNLEVHEIILGDAFLMSSLFTEAEKALARLGLDAVEGEKLDVVVGGLGLGYTAVAALENPRLRSLRVVEFLEPVIDWHRSELLPLGREVNGDERCQLVQGDFFAMAADSFAPSEREKKFDAVLLDIDHSPEELLSEAHSGFYTTAGLGRMADQLRPGGVFGLWSDAPPEEDFLQVLESVFASAKAHIVEFDNPLRETTSASTVYVAKKT